MHISVHLVGRIQENNTGQCACMDVRTHTCYVKIHLDVLIQTSAHSLGRFQEKDTVQR
jgi:hypothetical protein